MTQHLRPGRKARENRQESARNRMLDRQAMTEEERAVHDAAAKAEYDLAHG